MRDRSSYRTVGVGALLACVLCGAPLAGTGTADSVLPIYWKSPHTAQTDAAKAPAETASKPIGAAAPAARHVVVQFNGIATDADREQLAASGVTLLRYLGSNAYFAKVSQEASVAAVPGLSVAVVQTSEIDPVWKLHPMLADRAFPAYAVSEASAVGTAIAKPGTHTESVVEIVAVYVLFHPDVDIERDGVAAIDGHGGKVRSLIRSINGLVAWLPVDNLSALAAEDVVQWIEPALPPLSELNDSNRIITQVNEVQASGLDGSGVNVLVYDGGSALDSHEDFRDSSGARLFRRDSSEISNHSTHVAGTIGGDGSLSDGLYRGMAPGVTMQSYGFEQDGGLQPGFLYTDPGDLDHDYDEAINTWGAIIANNSIGTNVAANGYPCDWEGDYGATSILIDRIVRGDAFGAPTRVIWANGNERGSGRCGTTYATTAPPACAKNHITVGAVNSNDDSMTTFSSWGPTDDGRLKPDISGPGCQTDGDGEVTSTSSTGNYTGMCGTSMAAPTVTGICALLLQDWMQTRADPLPRNSTLKVLLVHNAVDRGNVGPDYQFGYGSVRAQNALDFMDNGSFTEDEISNGVSKVFLVYVESGTPNLKATLAWDDPAGAVNTIPELVNDLDIVAISPTTAAIYYPWTLDPTNPANPAVRSQPDRINNIEQVVVENPQPGLWILQVTGHAVPEGPQPFSVATTPDMQLCSSAGVLSLDADAYGCNGVVTINVNDCDLDTDPSAVETVSVVITSSSEPGGESVLLTETGPNSATFEGTISLSTVNSPGVLRVVDGGTLVATYIDADDGSGQPATVQDSAVVDCVPPVISNVDVSGISGTEAVVLFDTDEPAMGDVRYGLSCANLTDTAQGKGRNTAHSIGLSGLTPTTDYYFAIDATDAAGNTASDDNGGACHTFRTAEIGDYFTEEFTGDNDIEGYAMLLTPNASPDHYAGCVETITALPTSPDGGTPLPLDDDAYATVTLSGVSVSLYGVDYSTFYVGSNGYITFNAGSTDYTESLSEHFMLPRISACYDDFNPAAAGSVSWQQLEDRVAVTWYDVPEWNTLNHNTFQVEMFFDGRLRLSWLEMTAADGIAGISAGSGLPPDFVERDITAYAICAPIDTLNVTPYDDFTASGPLGGPFTPDHTMYTLTNSSATQTLDWQVTANQSWVDVGPPTSGSLAPNGAATVEVRIADEATSLPMGVYDATVTFMNLVTSTEHPRGVKLTVEGPCDAPPVATDVVASGTTDAMADVTLTATDCNNDPMTFIITDLPVSGRLVDPNGGDIVTAPYTLLNNGDGVGYIPPFGFVGTDTFHFKANDGGTPPTGGDSNVATVSVIITNCMFFDHFPSPAIDTAKWPTIVGATVDTVGIDEPTEPYALRLNGDPGGGESVTSTALDLAGRSLFALRYWYQRTGGGESPESGDDLIVEYRTNTGAWAELARHLGAGTDMTTFVEEAVSLPEDAYHANFQVRFRNIADVGPNDDWFVDDVCIGQIIPPHLADFDTDGDVDLTDYGFFHLCFNGPNKPPTLQTCDLADFDGDGDVDLSDFGVFLSCYNGPMRPPLCQ
jgi:hypothetical protein